MLVLLSVNLVTEEADNTSNELEASVNAEVIEESCDQIDEESVRAIVEELTNSYEEDSGTFEIDNICEGSICLKLLREHYDVEVDLVDNAIVINYKKQEDLTEDLNDKNDESRMNIIMKFMQGDIPLFSDEGTPLVSYIHLDELDSNGYEYYYDEESGAIVTYPVRGN